MPDRTVLPCCTGTARGARSDWRERRHSLIHSECEQCGPLAYGWADYRLEYGLDDDQIRAEGRFPYYFRECHCPTHVRCFRERSLY